MLSIGTNFLKNTLIDDKTIINLDDTKINRINTGFIYNCDHFCNFVRCTSYLNFNVFSDSDTSFSSDNRLSDLFVKGFDLLLDDLKVCTSFHTKFPNRSNSPFRNCICKSEGVLLHIRSDSSNVILLLNQSELASLSNPDPPETTYTFNYFTFAKSDVLEVDFKYNSIITSLPDYCFANFINMKMNPLSSNITKIGSFFRLNNLISNETEIITPSSITSIGSNYYCGISDFTGVFKHYSNIIPSNSFTALDNTVDSFVKGFSFFVDPNTCEHQKVFYNVNPNSFSGSYRNWNNIIILSIEPDCSSVAPTNTALRINTNIDSYFLNNVENFHLIEEGTNIKKTFDYIPSSHDPLVFKQDILFLHYNQPIHLSTTDRSFTLSFNTTISYYSKILTVIKNENETFKYYDFTTDQTEPTEEITYITNNPLPPGTYVTCVSPLKFYSNTLTLFEKYVIILIVE